jgi:hypothetical protein
MSDRFYGIERGNQGVRNVTESASTTSLDVEVRVDLIGMSKLEVLLAIDTLREAIAQDAWPPA